MSSPIRQLHPQSSVRVENVPQYVSLDDVRKLFEDKIGRVVNIQDNVTASTHQRWLEVTLESQEAAKAALALTEQLLGGMPIYVSELFDPDLLVEAGAKSFQPPPDETRRNLYVLGLPHDFTLDEFKTLFQPFGPIEHAVILAVLDNYSRRRGFVVFSSNSQARSAMRAMHKATIKGHQLNVSWAVVQRSSGFLDGEDRVTEGLYNVVPQAKPKPNRSNPKYPSGTPITSSLQSNTSPSLHSTHPLDNSSNPFPAFASTLLVSNLCPWLFQTHVDIHALFAPYGLVKRITIIPPSPLIPPQMHNPHAALVEYEDVQAALSALLQVNNRTFGTCVTRASFFRDAMQRAMAMQMITAPLGTIGGSLVSPPPAYSPDQTETIRTATSLAASQHVTA